MQAQTTRSDLWVAKNNAKRKKKKLPMSVASSVHFFSGRAAPGRASSHHDAKLVPFRAATRRVRSPRGVPRVRVLAAVAAVHVGPHAMFDGLSAEKGECVGKIAGGPAPGASAAGADPRDVLAAGALLNAAFVRAVRPALGVRAAFEVAEAVGIRFASNRLQREEKK